MKVKELIEELRQYDENLEVVIPDYETNGDHQPVKLVHQLWDGRVALEDWE